MLQDLEVLPTLREVAMSYNFFFGVGALSKSRGLYSSLCSQAKKL